MDIQIMFLTRSDDFSRYSYLERLKSLLQTQNIFLENYITCQYISPME